MNRNLNILDAIELFKQYCPLLEYFEDNNVDYCLVGGVAILAHCIKRDVKNFRSTTDADLILPSDYSNVEFSQDYIKAYSSNSEEAIIVSNALLGVDGLKELSKSENRYANISFIGSIKELDGIDTPDFDVARSLNGFTLKTIQRERLLIAGTEFWLASIETLIQMKQKTIEIYGHDVATNPRFQDFIDLETLKNLK